ncbi:hypothetical protein GCM10027429_27220 [Marivirga atlantica]
MACGYGIYYFWDKQKSLDAWSLVPDNTLVVYENSNLVSTWNDLQKNPIWKDLLEIPELAQLKANFEKLDSLSGGSGALDEFSRNNRVLISMHLTAKDDFDFVFYQTLKNTEQVTTIKEIQEEFKTLRVNERKFENYTINELKNNSNEVVFSYLILKGNFVGSFSPILVEDVIRNLSKEAEGFKQLNQEIFKIAKFQNDAGNFFINFNRLNRFLRIFTESQQHILFDVLSKFSGSTFLDLVINDEDFYFNGYTFLTDSSAFLKIYKNQKGGKITVQDLIPNRTAILIQEKFDKPEALMNAKEVFWSQTVDNYSIERTQMSRKFKTDFTGFHKFMAGENAMAMLKTNTVQKETDKLVFIKLADISEGLNEFNKLSEEAALANNDTLYYETYANQEIRELKIEEFPKWLLGANYGGFETSYFSLFGNFMVLSNNIQSIKSLILDIETENTWGKSIKQYQFIKSTLEEANLNIFINTNQVWQLMLPALNEKWESFTRKNEYPLKNLENLAIQFSAENDRFYTNIEFSHRPKEKLDQLSQFESIFATEFAFPITSKPFVVKNHNSGLFETLVQDSAYNLHLIGNDGAQLWSEKLDGPIVSDVFQIDYLRNNKLQYAFATDKQIYVMDRNGNELSGFPKNITKDTPIAYFNVVDYDKSKNYRFLTSTKTGDIYLSDKTGDLLGDWDPLRIGDKLATTPEHIRIRSKDFMVALQESGNVNVMSRNSRMKPNFPVRLDDRLTDNLFFELGNTFEQSNIVTLTAGGQLTKVSFEGKIKDKVQMYKPNKETIFKIIPNATERNYIIARQDLNRVSILDYHGELLFDKDYLSQQEMAIQYYQFSTEKEIIVITDLAQQFTYFYTMDGTLINQQPIESDHEVAVIYYSKENTIHIYKCIDNNFEILKLKF